ncbi:MAG: carbohydrate porin [Planctomyces sp.]
MSSHDHAPRRSEQPEWRHRGSIRFLTMACGFTLALVAELQKAHSQHVLPVPGCPARGLTPPGDESLPYLERGFGCSPSGCNEISAAPEEEDSGASPLALPDWAHQYRGITGEYIYTGEVFSNVHGGVNTNGATRYRGNLDLVMNVDTEGMDLWKGGRLFVYGSQFHGQTLTPRDVGDTQLYSNIESNPRPENELQLTEFWYEHSFADGALIVKMGKQDANADFAFVDLGGDFINSSFGLIPTVPLPTWPNPGMGIAVFADLTDTWHFKTGIYDGAPTFGAPTGGQWGFSTVGEFGAMSLYELSWTPQFGPDGDLPATFRLGSWYHSGDFDNLAAGVGTVSGNHGYYASVDQLLWKEPGSDDAPQGLGAFLQYGWSPSDRNAVDRYIGSGVTYRGPLRGHDADLIGVGIASADFSDRTLLRENAFEVFYKAQIFEWMVLQPDTQYIAKPSGNGRDAFIIGLRSEIVF